MEEGRSGDENGGVLRPQKVGNGLRFIQHFSLTDAKTCALTSSKTFMQRLFHRLHLMGCLFGLLLMLVDPFHCARELALMPKETTIDESPGLYFILACVNVRAPTNKARAEDTSWLSNNFLPKHGGITNIRCSCPVALAICA